MIPCNWRFPKLCAPSLVMALVVSQGPALAQSGEADQRVNFFVSQRFWVASWEQRLVDMRLVAAPTATTPPVVSVAALHSASTKTVPITTLGARYGQVIATVSKFHDTAFDSNGNTSAGVTRRNELDLSIGYQVIPGLTLSYIRKSGYTSANNSISTARLLGSDGDSKGAGNLIGISASTALSDRISAYGNLAAGPGKFKYRQTDGSTLAISGRYVIADFGLAFRAAEGLMAGAIDAVTLQVGYRTQSINFPVINFPLQAAGFSVIEGQNRGRTTTEGLVFSIGAVF